MPILKPTEDLNKELNQLSRFYVRASWKSQQTGIEQVVAKKKKGTVSQLCQKDEKMNQTVEPGIPHCSESTKR